MSDHFIRLARGLIEASKRPVILTGAGISAESGIPTFRGDGGYWRGRSFEHLASVNAFCEDPREQWEWYLERRRTCWGAKPNAGHHAIAKFQRRTSAKVLTQNVDGLHERAGAEVTRIHGSLWENKCSRCLRISIIVPETSLSYEELPTCPECGGQERVGVVWFGESIPVESFVAASKATEDCDLMIVVGTSGTVFPAAGWVTTAVNRSIPVIEVNPEPAFSRFADVCLKGPGGEFLPMILE